jgi:alpha-tubulin suppressor-like RCC1 family protein
MNIFRLKKIYLISFSLIFVVLLFLGAKSCNNRNTSNTKSGSSDVSTFRINAPSNLTATAVSSYQIDLSWQDNANNEDGFEIERSTDGINYAPLSTLNTNSISYSDTGVRPFICYYYRVRAFNNIGDRSEYSNEVYFYSSLPVWSQVKVGAGYTIAMTTDGRLWSWGYNLSSQLGAGYESSYKNYYFNLISLSDPSVLPNLITETDWSRVICGSYHNLGIKTDGTLWSWGNNAYGELGMGDSEASSEPFQVGFDTDWSGIAAGFGHSVCLKNNGTLWSCGANMYGQLGLGDNDGRLGLNQVGGDIPNPHPALTATLNSLNQVDLYWSDTDNETGFRIFRYPSIPPDFINPLFIFDSNVTFYSDTTVISNTDYSYRVEAFNNLGEVLSSSVSLSVTTTNIGNSFFVNSYPTQRFTSGWSMVVANGGWWGMTSFSSYTAALKTNGTIWGWGKNNYGQLGVGDTFDRSTPSSVGDSSDWVEISVGVYHTIARKTNGTIWGWGANRIYNYASVPDTARWGRWQLGLGVDDMYRTTPSPIGVDSDWITVAAGGKQTLAIKSNGTLWGWGKNATCQLGLGDVLTRKTPTPIGTDSDWQTVATGGAWWTQYNQFYGYTLAVKTNGILWAWGYNNYGQLGLGDTSYRMSPFQVFGKPTSLTSFVITVISSSQINLSWFDLSYNEEGFQIERKISGTDYSLLATVKPNVTSYSDTTGFAPGTTYYYRIKAYNSFGESVASIERNATISGIPSNLSVTAVSLSQVDLSWTDTADNEIGFKIERSYVITDSYVEIDTVGQNVILYTDTTVTSGNIYYYQIRAYNAYGDSSSSNEVNVTVPPGEPTILTATAISSSRIDLGWTNVNGETGYEIERSPTSATGYSLIVTVGSDVTLYPDLVLTPNTTYYYRVRAYNAGGNGDYSTEVNVTTPTGPPAVPALLNVNVISRTRLDLIWSDINGETGYNIERSTVSSVTGYSLLATIGSDVTSYADTTVIPSNTYYYRISSYNAWGDSAYSGVISGTTPAVPTPFRPLNIDTPPVDSYNDGGGVMTAGYKFTPLVNGTIIALGRYIGYTSAGAANITVILWEEVGDGTTGTELGRVTVPANIGWQWANLIAPIPVTAGAYYRVSVFCDIDSGSGTGDYWWSAFSTSTPVIRGNIQINASCYDYGTDVYPSYTDTSYMYGWADIEFLEE